MSQLTFTGDGKEIADALRHLASSLPRKSTLPVLSCVALRLEGGRLYGTVTNLDQYHRVALPVAIEEGKEGAGACVALSLLGNVLARCNGDGCQVSIAYSGEVSVVAGGSKAKLHSLPLAEFPERKQEEDTWESIDSERLVTAMQGVAFAMSDDTTRYEINGMYFTDDGRVVATNGRMLALHRIDPEKAPAALSGVILPGVAVDPICQLLDRNPSVEISGSEAGVSFRGPDEEYYTKKIEGNYPNFQRVVPRFSKPIRASIPRGALCKALAWAKLFSCPKTKSVKLTCDGQQLVIAARTPDVGDAEDRITLTKAVKDGFQMAVDRTFLESFAVRDGGETFLLEIEDTGGSGPILILEEGSDFLGVLMPMRIAE
jgi:DNA polymerase-3 subunit beta